MRRPKPPEKPQRPAKRPSRAAPPAEHEQEIHVDTDRWSGFRDSFGEIDALMRLKTAGNLHGFPLIGRCSIALEHPIAIQGDCSSGRIITISKNRGNLDRREQKQDNSVPAMALAHENLSLLLFSFRRRSRLTGKKQLRDRVIENAVIFAHPRQRRSLSS